MIENKRPNFKSEFLSVSMAISMLDFYKRLDLTGLFIKEAFMDTSLLLSNLALQPPKAQKIMKSLLLDIVEELAIFCITPFDSRNIPKVENSLPKRLDVFEVIIKNVPLPSYENIFMLCSKEKKLGFCKILTEYLNLNQIYDRHKKEITINDKAYNFLYQIMKSQNHYELLNFFNQLYAIKEFNLLTWKNLNWFIRETTKLGQFRLLIPLIPLTKPDNYKDYINQFKYVIYSMRPNCYDNSKPSSMVALLKEYRPWLYQGLISTFGRYHLHVIKNYF